MANRDESEAISALTGFSIKHVLGDLSLPSGDGLTNRLGISGLPSLNADQIYSDKWEDDDEVVGPEQGQDWEDEIDREMREEGDGERTNVEREDQQRLVRPKEKRMKIVKRLVERPKSVYERFPAFEKDKVLDFSELFKGYTVHKSRLSKRPYQGKYVKVIHIPLLKTSVENVYPRKRETTKGFLDAVVGDAKRQVENQRVEEEMSAGNIETDLRKALEVCSRLSYAFCYSG